MVREHIFLDTTNLEGTKMDTQDEVILMGPILTMAPESDALNRDVLARLLLTWSHTPATTIAQMSRYRLTEQLLTTLPDDLGFGNELRLKVAEEITALLKRLGFQTQPAQPVAPTVVRVERNYREMSLRQLLEAVIANPDVFDEAVRYILSHPELSAAARKTHKWVIPAHDEGGIDLEATMRYVTQLNRPHSVVQRTVEGRRPISLNRAMGVNDQPLIHPITGRLVQGPDSNGFDWSTLDLEVLEAILWARKIGHDRLPDLESDVYGWSEQLFQNPLPRRFQDIMDDYRTAKKDRDSTVDGIRADWPEDLPHDGVFTFYTARTVGYEALVREAANLAAPCRASGTGASVQGGAYTTIHVSGTGASISGTVVLDGGKITGTGVSGVVYMPPGGSIRVSGIGASVRVVNQTWKQLAERLGLA